MSETTQDTNSTTTTTTTITLIAKWAKERITLTTLSPETTIGAVKEMLCEKTCILPKRQKLVGLTKKAGGPVGDEVLLVDLKVKKSKAAAGKTNGLILPIDSIVHEFILVRGGIPFVSFFYCYSGCCCLSFLVAK